ncbi:ABC transporter permease, partial [Mesorhizobium sp. M1C.F.Ca.ET.187.01.1.1]|uniref:ABC transporter permease n=1 Tax=Mesorhizobium sp. M1C.F.Ca.ET.187.01.1.1 TaxID=2563923 RepID=UPI001FE0AB8B
MPRACAASPRRWAIWRRPTVSTLPSSPITAQSRRAALQGSRRANTQVLGVGADLPRVRGLRLKAGRFFTDDEVHAHRAVGVLDQKAAKALSSGSPVGSTVLLGGMPVEVIGVVGTSAFAGGAT